MALVHGRRRRHRISLIVLSFTLSALSMEIGVNVPYLADWSGEWPFANLMLTCRGWNAANAGDPSFPDFGSWTNPANLAMPADSLGYPLQVPFSWNSGQYGVATVMMVDVWTQGYPFGTFTLRFEGKGEVVIGWDAPTATIEGRGGETVHEFTISSIGGPNTGSGSWLRSPRSTGLFLGIKRSEASDHIRNIRVLLPGYGDGTKFFTDEFLQDYRPFTPIRFMNWCGANMNIKSLWTQRTKPGAIYWAWDVANSIPGTAENDWERVGVPYEYMIDAGNTLKRDIWLSCPTMADETYMRELAKLVKQRLNPLLKCFIEWGNETWWEPAANYAYDQLFPGVEDNFCKHGTQAAKLFKAFEDEFGSEMSSRVVKVLTGQTGNSGVLECILNDFNDPRNNPWGITGDACAVTCYFDEQGFDWQTYDAEKQLARANDLTFIAYEGGTEKGDTAVLYNLYATVLQQAQSHLNIFMQYTNVGAWGQSGHWGAKEFTGQNMSQAPKYRALYDYAVAHGQYDPNQIAVKPDREKMSPARNPASGLQPDDQVTVYSLSGKELFSGPYRSLMRAGKPGRLHSGVALVFCKSGTSNQIYRLVTLP